jgi:hypothetical protein
VPFTVTCAVLMTTPPFPPVVAAGVPLSVAADWLEEQAERSRDRQSSKPSGKGMGLFLGVNFIDSFLLKMSLIKKEYTLFKTS